MDLKVDKTTVTITPFYAETHHQGWGEASLKSWTMRLTTDGYSTRSSLITRRVVVLGITYPNPKANSNPWPAALRDKQFLIIC